jgi:hypothetical protein
MSVQEEFGDTGMSNTSVDHRSWTDILFRELHVWLYLTKNVVLVGIKWKDIVLLP